MGNYKSAAGGLDRREILKLAGYGTLGILAGGLWPFFDLSTASQHGGADQKTGFSPDLDISLSAQPAEVPIFPGEPTRVWRYHAIVHTGSRDRVIRLPQSYLGPIICVNRGEKVRIRFRNDTPEKSIVHWHGLHVPAIMDGHPRHVVSTGESYLYEFDVGAAGGGMMMSRGMMPGQYLPNGAGLTIFKTKVTKHVKNNHQLPNQLSEITPLRPNQAVNYHRPRQFYLTMSHMQWSINGRAFQMETVAEDEFVQLGSKEIWEFHNTGGGMMNMMNMPHPIHLHGKQFRILERSGVRHVGYIDEGWKDTVLLMPGERVRLLVDFDDYPGLFLYHCHNLEHEDMGMMRNYFVSGSIGSGQRV